MRTIVVFIAIIASLVSGACSEGGIPTAPSASSATKPPMPTATRLTGVQVMTGFTYQRVQPVLNEIFINNTPFANLYTVDTNRIAVGCDFMKISETVFECDIPNSNTEGDGAMSHTKYYAMVVDPAVSKPGDTTTSKVGRLLSSRGTSLNDVVPTRDGAGTRVQVALDEYGNFHPWSWLDQWAPR